MLQWNSYFENRTHKCYKYVFLNNLSLRDRPCLRQAGGQGLCCSKASASKISSNTWKQEQWECSGTWGGIDVSKWRIHG